MTLTLRNFNKSKIVNWNRILVKDLSKLLFCLLLSCFGVAIWKEKQFPRSSNLDERLPPSKIRLKQNRKLRHKLSEFFKTVSFPSLFYKKRYPESWNTLAKHFTAWECWLRNLTCVNSLSVLFSIGDSLVMSSLYRRTIGKIWFQLTLLHQGVNNYGLLCLLFIILELNVIFLVTSSVALEPDWPRDLKYSGSSIKRSANGLGRFISRIFEKTTKMFVVSRYTMITLQNPAFPDLNNCLST